jgi:toxin ParE1/3/4
MKVVYTEDALKDLDAIAEWLSVHYPAVASRVEWRIRSAVARIARWPQSARRSANHPAVRVTSLDRYPYRIFYRVTDDTIEILHIHHGARQPWDEQA